VVKLYNFCSYRYCGSAPSLHIESTDSLIGATRSEPHTSITALCTCVCTLAAICGCYVIECIIFQIKPCNLCPVNYAEIYIFSCAFSTAQHCDS